MCWGCYLIWCLQNHHVDLLVECDRELMYIAQSELVCLMGPMCFHPNSQRSQFLVQHYPFWYWLFPGRVWNASFFRVPSDFRALGCGGTFLMLSALMASICFLELPLSVTCLFLIMLLPIFDSHIRETASRLDRNLVFASFRIFGMFCFHCHSLSALHLCHTSCNALSCSVLSFSVFAMNHSTWFLSSATSFLSCSLLSLSSLYHCDIVLILFLSFLQSLIISGNDVIYLFRACLRSWNARWCRWHFTSVWCSEILWTHESLCLILVHRYII